MDTLTVQVWKLGDAGFFGDFKSPAAMLVALYIARSSRANGSCWAKQSTIGDAIGVSKNTVGRCIDELVERGLLTRINRRRKDGSRTSDLLWLTLPEIVLESTTVDLNAHKRQANEDAGFEYTVDSQEPTSAPCKDPPCDQPDPTVGSLKGVNEIVKGNQEKRAREILISDEDLEKAVEAIRARASEKGRDRSPRSDLRKALKAAIARGHSIETVMRGLGGYFATDDATKDDGAFQRGAHVMLANDRFLDFLPSASDAPADVRAREEVGTSEAPTRRLQELWMSLFTQGMPWNPDRGPQPGRLGCRIDDDLQRKFGVEPFGAALDSDASAFD